MNDATHAPTTSLRSTLTTTLMSVFLLVGTFAGWMSVGQAPKANSIVLVLITAYTVVILVFLALAARRHPYSLHVMHLLALFLFLGISALLQYSSGEFAVAGPVTGVRRQIFPAVTTVGLWLFGYLTAYESHRILAGTPNGPIVRFLERPLAPGRTQIVMVLALLSVVYLGAAGLLGAATRGAALESMREFAEQSGAGAYTSVWYMLNLLLFRAFSLVAMMAGLLVYLRDRRNRSPASGFLLLLMGIGLVVANNPFAAARMWLAITVIGFLAPFFLRRMRTATMLVAIALGGIAFLPALNRSRHALAFDEWWDYFLVVSPIEYLANSSDVDSLGMLSLVYHWTELYGHRMGMQMLGAALFWVPRTLWPGKPIGTGGMVTGDLGFEFTNLAPPIMSDPLIDLGFAGVPVVGAFFGLVLGRLDLTYWHGRTRPDASLRVIDCIYPFWLGCVIFLTRGGLFASLGWTTCFTVWILLLAVGQRWRSPGLASLKPETPPS